MLGSLLNFMNEEKSCKMNVVIVLYDVAVSRS